MDVSKCEQKSYEKPDLRCLPIADCAKELEPLVKQHYLEKISAIGIDPVLIEGKHFEADCLPPVESTDLLFYLVLETSFNTQQQFKAFRSLEAYNQMLSGFIASVQGHIIANRFVVLAKVRHSQLFDPYLDYYGKRGEQFCPLIALVVRLGWQNRVHT